MNGRIFRSAAKSATQESQSPGPRKSSEVDKKCKGIVSIGRRQRMFIPQEIIDQIIRRPLSTIPPPLPRDMSSLNDDLGQFTALFSGKQFDDLVIYKIMETYVFNEARGLADIQRFLGRLSLLALYSHTNVPSICKYLYVFSQDPRESKLRNAFFSNLESDYMNRAELKEREGPIGFRNFIRWVMATAHHYRNLLYAPFDEIMLSLLELANDISDFSETGDIQLYVTLVLRYQYYSSLPCSDGTDVRTKLGEKHTTAIARARHHVRQRVTQGGLSNMEMNWLILLLDSSGSSPTKDKDIVEHYGKILPGFSILLPETLKIRLPPRCPRARHLEHISTFIWW